MNRILPLVIALVQAVDLIVHAATNQLEPLRVTANAIMLVWAAVAVSGKPAPNLQRLTAAGAGGSYLVLNLIFLARDGMTNPAQGGGLRVTLLLFVGLTVALAVLWTVRWRRQPS